MLEAQTRKWKAFKNRDGSLFTAPLLPFFCFLSRLLFVLYTADSMGGIACIVEKADIKMPLRVVSSFYFHVT